MRKAAGIGPPDVVKATCPVRGALGGNPLSRGSTDAVLRLHELSTAWFSHIEQPRHAMPPPPAAHLWPRAVGTLGLLPALQGGGTRPCSRWVPRDSRALFPRLPARTRLLRLLKPQQDWTQVCWAAPTVLGGSATEGSAWLPPRRAGRRPPPRGRTGLANPRWMGGGTL